MTVARDGIDLPGLDDEMRTLISERVVEFEANHEDDLKRDGPGWVPRIGSIDYIIAGAISLILTIWLIAALV
jgi:hypothetical protein